MSEIDRLGLPSSMVPALMISNKKGRALDSSLPETSMFSCFSFAFIDQQIYIFLSQ